MTLALEQTGSASSQVILMLEKKYGTLPVSYRKFLKHHDGAIPPQNTVRGTDYNVGVRAFLLASDILKGAQSISGLSPRLMPIAEDNCGNYICISTDNHKIYFWDHEIEQIENIAFDFDDFIRKLEPFDISDIDLDSIDAKLIWIDPNFKPEFD